MIYHVILEREGEQYAPPSKVMKVAFSNGFAMPDSGEWQEPIVYFEIGEFDEDTYHTDFRTDESRQFSVTLDDLLDALIAIGATAEIASLHAA